MGKQVVVISGSPRQGGNSDSLCDQFVLGAQAAGHHAEKICLREKQIGYCLACDACKSGGGNCVQRDDMEAILAKLIAADVIVLATPVYFYTMNGQLKTLIDRTYARSTEITDKELYFIATAAVGSKQALERTIEGLRGFAACLTGAREKGVIYGTGLWNIGDVQGKPLLKQAYAMGQAV
jgi:multimeric flavodoxin WrbA